MIKFSRTIALVAVSVLGAAYAFTKPGGLVENVPAAQTVEVSADQMPQRQTVRRSANTFEARPIEGFGDDSDVFEDPTEDEDQQNGDALREDAAPPMATDSEGESAAPPPPEQPTRPPEIHDDSRLRRQVY
jgi:hypothetical protein